MPGYFRFLCFGFMLFAMNLAGQPSLPKNLSERNEIAFTFEIKSLSELEQLSKMISIDRVDGLKVRAYANIPQYLKFMQSGYELTLLPYAGEGVSLTMKNNVVLSPLTLWNFYPTYTAYESLMAQFQSAFPSICQLDTLTTLASGRRLLMLKISDNVNTDEAEPEFLYTSSIHGDETTGYILLMHLADYLLSNYGTNPEATDLINNLEIYICPLANPDGTYYGGNNTVLSARRYNANGVDLNRNYPDPQDGQHPDGNAWQPETVAFMDFAAQRHFVTGINFHGGAEVFNYPWDTWPTLHAENNWFYMVAREYADTVHAHSPSTYMDFMNNGITNGYAWYEVAGGRQDYMNYFHHCLESTIEVSDVKLLPSSQLLTLWDYNWRSMILLLKQARYSVHGLVTSQATGQPVPARVFISGHDINQSEVYASASVGDYHRMLKAGTYTLEFSADCYVTQSIPNVVVTDYATVNLNVQMVPAAGVTTAAVTSIVGSTAVSGGNVICTGSAPVTSRGVCWSTTANPTIADNHTTDGSGMGTFTSQITGLAPSTLYHVRAYVTNSQGTFYGADVAFNSACGTVTSFPWNEGFENAGSIPGCWTQQQVNSSGVNWTFITGSGNGHPATAHGGTYNACLKDGNAADNKTRLITPPLQIQNLPMPTLKFWHTQAVWYTDQDKLSVFYRTSAAGTWTLLVTYSNSITTWTQETITLPNPSNDYYIAFEGNAKWGYGICIDDVQVLSACPVINPVSVTISSSGNPVLPGTLVTFAAEPQNEGTSPAYQWKKNGTDIPGATSSVFDDTPLNNDAYVCVLTSSNICVSGNPATSNTIIMQVETAPLNREVIDVTVIPGQSLCFDALQHIVVAGNDHYFTVTAGSEATFIAGASINFLPGASVAYNGRMTAYIAPAGPFCSQGDHVGTAETGFANNPSDSHSRLSVWPNPAEDFLNLYVSVPESASKGEIRIYDSYGKLVLATFAGTFMPQRISLPELPDGLYLLIYSRDGRSEGCKFLKYR
jgi:hypothetical protein